MPDLVAETGSPGGTRKEVAEKVARWLSPGVRLVWEVNPAPRIVTVHRGGVPARALGVADTLDGGDVLPGFSVAVQRLFP